MDIKVVFMGTPEFSIPILEALIENYDVIGVVTQPDKLVGRKGILTPSPIKVLATSKNIKVLQPNKIRTDYEEILDLKPDLIITCAYGQIVPKEILDCPKYGCINVHASILPNLRGGAPINRAIMNGLNKTGITIMYMAEGMDDGDIIEQEEITIEKFDTATTLSDKLSKLGSKLLIETLPSIINGTNKRVKQNPTLVTFAPIIKKEDEVLDFNKDALEIYNKIRGLSNIPGAYFILDSKRFKVFESIISSDKFENAQIGEIVKIYKEGIGIKTQSGVIILTVIQPEGKSKMLAKDYINGIKDSIVGKVVQI